mmetsp:Transcript_50722/g.162878  ORF Transcript_50722/g.162878 Transcript_50722/m.162878 type:complete len:359 (+) Transcript_50722:354-1430(+)
MSTQVGFTIQPATYWQLFIQEMCDAIGDFTDACWQSSHYPETDSSLFTAEGSPAKVMFDALAKVLLRDMQAPASFFPPETLGRVMSFPSVASYNGSNNLAIQEEDPSIIFKACTKHDDCEADATACGNLAKGNPICSRQFVLPMYCGSVCRTGGCGPGGQVLPYTKGSYCQPCDGCALEATGSAFVCPAKCAGYLYEKDKMPPVKNLATSMLPQMRPPTYSVEYDQKGSFSMSTWVRHFDTQWLFKKEIRIPGLPANTLGYDAATSMLTCWRLSPFEVQFRNRWDEEDLTVVKNPLSSRLLAKPDDWHFLVLLKGSYMDKSDFRRDELTWMVDGEIDVSAGQRRPRREDLGGSPIWFP